MKTKTALSLSVLVSLILGCGFLLAVDIYRGLSQSLSLEHNPVLEEKELEQHSFMVEEGDSLARIASKLHDAGRLDHPRDSRYMTLAGRLSGRAGQIHVGEYDLQRLSNPWLLFQAMVSGDVRQHSFTIVEGWNLRQLLTALAESPKLMQSEPALTQAVVAEHLGLEDMHPEGWFLPDTYLFPKGAEDISILRRAYAAMLDTLEAEWEKRAENLPYDKPYEALIMASIIEKETAVAEERGQIAGVFVRRLDKGMRLQTDPTVIYGIGESYDGNIRRRDLRTDTPYNTYTRAGLPPTPIAMPGRASIHAALHPTPGDSLYFVSRGDGSHVF